MLAGFRYMDRSHQERVITALFYRARSREGDGGWVVKSLRVGRTKTTSGGFRWRSGKTVLLFLARLAVGRGRRRGTGASATLWRGRGDR